MDDHTRQITDTSGFTHLSPFTVFLRTKPAWKIRPDELLILLGLLISHRHKPFNRLHSHKDHNKTNYWWYFIHPSTTPLLTSDFTRQTTFLSPEPLSFIYNERYHVTKETKGSGDENRQTTFSSPEPLGLICSHRDHVIKRNYGVWER